MVEIKMDSDKAVIAGFREFFPRECTTRVPLGAFPDDFLMLALMEELGVLNLESVTIEYLGEVTTLHVLGVRDLTGIELLVNLTVLDTTLSRISDISPLASLTNLTDLDLSGNQIRDTSPLVRLDSLTNLDLRNNEITDISPLVATIGLGSGDTVHLDGNNLDIWEGSEDLIAIRVLQKRGVIVLHDPIGTGVPPSPAPPTYAYDDLLDDLRDAGAAVNEFPEPVAREPRHRPDSSLVDVVLLTEGRLVEVNRQTIYVYEFPDESAATRELGYVSPTGWSINIPHGGGVLRFVAEWGRFPHYYWRGRVIVLYIGVDTCVLGALESVLGTQFAGTVIHGGPPCHSLGR